VANNILGIDDVETLSTSLTAGSIAFSDGSTLTEDNANLFWDDSNNRLGIGTASPTEALDVSGKIALDGTQVAYRPTAFTGTLILGDGGGSLDTGADYNTFVGIGAGQNNTTGSRNTANGYRSLFSNTTGSRNTANGYQAGRYIASGGANETGTYNTFIGADTKALADGDTNEIVIGYNAVGVGSNSVVLGNDSIATTVLKGNVGIGTTNPTKKLDVNGDIRSTNIEIGGDVFFEGLTRNTKNDVVFFD
jgi:hypothetical protein